MERSKNLIGSLSLLLIIFSQACITGKKESATQATIPANAILVTVTDYRDLDGCEFLLVTGDGKKLQPVNLPENLRKNGIQLYITYKVSKGMGICMAGEMVELIFIREKK